MADPDGFDVDEATAALLAHDWEEDIDLGVWEHETPKSSDETINTKLPG